MEIKEYKDGDVPKGGKGSWDVDGLRTALEKAVDKVKAGKVKVIRVKVDEIWDEYHDGDRPKNKSYYGWKPKQVIESIFDGISVRSVDGYIYITKS